MPREIYGPLYGVKDAAKYLGIGVNRVYQKCHDKELACIKDKNGYLIAKSILDDHIEFLYKKEKSPVASGDECK